MSVTAIMKQDITTVLPVRAMRILLSVPTLPKAAGIMMRKLLTDLATD